MNKVWIVIKKEIHEAIPAFVFFFVLFHLIGITRAVVEADYSLTALRAAGATIGALLVAKAVLIVEALPLSRRCPGPPIVRVFWTTALNTVVVLIFRILEEFLPLLRKHHVVSAAARAMREDVSWPLFWLLAGWAAFGLLLYGLAVELRHAFGPGAVKSALWGPPDGRAGK